MNFKKLTSFIENHKKEFKDVKLVQRHRKINELLIYELENGVHALSLHLFTTDEWKEKDEYVKDSPLCAK